MAEFDPAGANTTYYIANSPDATPIQDSHLFVEYINDEGQVVAEQVFTPTVPPGPTVWPVDLGYFHIYRDLHYGEDYTILALWTDGQGDIIDTSVRPLASFKEDPLPEVAHTGVFWDFGDVYVGEPVYKEFVVANIGQYDLPVMAVTDFVSGTILGEWRTKLSPTGSSTLGEIDTTDPGPVNGNIILRSSDLDEHTILIPVVGTIRPLPNLVTSSDDIVFSNDYPIDGELVTITATVHNTSTYPVENVVLRFFEGEPLAGAPQIGGDQVIAVIPAGDQASAQVSFSYTETRNHFHVSVDPENFVLETNEFDNDDRWFTNIQYVLPQNGVLTDGGVYHLTEPAQLTSTLVITGGAGLILQDVSVDIETLTIGTDATLIVKNSTIDVDQLGSSEAITFSVFIAATQPLRR